MDYQEAIEILKDFDSQVSAKADGAYQSTIGKMACDFAISAMQELQKLHDQGFSLDRMKDIDFRKEIVEHINYDAYMRLMDELEEYKQLGTLEEVQEAVEKQNAQETRIMLGMYGIVYECKECGNELEMYCEYCPFCGQRQKWSDEE